MKTTVAPLCWALGPLVGPSHVVDGVTACFRAACAAATAESVLVGPSGSQVLAAEAGDPVLLPVAVLEPEVEEPPLEHAVMRHVSVIVAPSNKAVIDLMWVLSGARCQSNRWSDI